MVKSYKPVVTLEGNKRQCSNCKEIKDLTEFVKRRGSKSGYRGVCKKCSNTLARTQTSYGTRCKEHKDEVRERKQQYQKEHHDEYVEYCRVYHAKNKDKRLQQATQYIKRNKHKRAAHSHLKYMQKKGKAPPRLTWCQLCGKEVYHYRIVAHHADYNYPLSVVYLCTKHHSEIHKWLRDIEATTSQALVVDEEYTSLLMGVLPTLAE